MKEGNHGPRIQENHQNLTKISTHPSQLTEVDSYWRLRNISTRNLDPYYPRQGEPIVLFPTGLTPRFSSSSTIGSSRAHSSPTTPFRSTPTPQTHGTNHVNFTNTKNPNSNFVETSQKTQARNLHQIYTNNH